MNDEIPKPRPYRPSNNTEADAFEAHFCDRCQHWSEVNPCPIYAAALLHDIAEPEYPAAWVRDADGQPTCTAFVSTQRGSALDASVPRPRKPIPGQLALFPEVADE